MGLLVPLARAAAALRRDTRGSSIIELCFVAPMLLVITCGIADVAMGFARRLAVQQAAARAVEMASAAGITNTMVTAAQNEAATAAGIATNKVTVDAWLECGGVRQATINDTCLTGTPARYLSVTIADTYVPTFGSFLSAVGAGSWASVNIPGFAVVRVQ